MYLLYYFLKLFYLELNAEFRKFIRNETSDLYIFMTYGTAILLKLWSSSLSIHIKVLKNTALNFIFTENLN